ncbi:MAG TPA: exosortase-associated EpsI family protein [Opitutaceae bacterium]|jgi:hypothetical protein
MRLSGLRLSLVLPAVVLAAAIGLQFGHLLRENPHPRDVRLAQAVPSSIPGWEGRDVPLGPSEFIAGEVEKVLNYDQVLYREFTRGGRIFGVYVAYWGAGKMPTRFVASHTPDRCWTENGWHCLDMKFKKAETFEGDSLQPAEWRLFEPPDGGRPTYVLYWHLVDGRVYDYGNRFNAVPEPVRWWKDAAQQVLLGSREQFFIRLTGNQPVEDLWQDPGVATVMRSLEKLGLSGNQAGRVKS